jgi:quercetin dioxygenase-like cupin family protein
MTTCGKFTGIALATLCAATAGCQALPAQVSSASRIALSHGLPQLDGAHLKASVVEVAYGPGNSSPAHSHPCPVIGYVVQGAIRMQVNEEPEIIYKAGESFYEAPNGAHRVSANASDREPAKLIAFFVCDHDTPLSVSVPNH